MSVLGSKFFINCQFALYFSLLIEDRIIATVIDEYADVQNYFKITFLLFALIKWTILELVWTWNSIYKKCVIWKLNCHYNIETNLCLSKKFRSVIFEFPMILFIDLESICNDNNGKPYQTHILKEMKSEQAHILHGPPMIWQYST